MLLPHQHSEVEPLFNFYRIGWQYAEAQLSFPDIDEDTQMSPAQLMYSRYDLQAGYIAYIHHVTKLGRGGV
jgi:hypothetical protein